MNRFIFSCTTFIFFLTSLSVLAEDIPFAIGEWEPYTGARMSQDGLATEIVTAACNAVELHCVFEFYPWKRAESLVENGSSFGTFPYQEMPGRFGRFQFSDKLFSSSFAILTHSTNTNTALFTYRNKESLKGHKIGIIAGTDAIKAPLGKLGITVEEVPTAYQNLKKLQSHRIDFYIDDRAVIIQALRTHFTGNQLAEFMLLDDSFGGSNDFKIMASKAYPKNQEILEKINAGLKTIRNNGTLDRLSGKYILRPQPIPR